MIRLLSSILAVAVTTTGAVGAPPRPDQVGREFDLYARNHANAVKKPDNPAKTDANSVKPEGDGSGQFDAAGRRVVTFAELAGFVYTPPLDGAEWPKDAGTGIPETVRKLDGRRVSISGYMLPIQMEAGRVKQFLILRNQMACCYGVAPAPNEWIVVRCKTGILPSLDMVTTFSGALRVGAMREQGYFIGIYELELE